MMNNQTIYDIIIENATKEYFSMRNINTLSNKIWETPQYTRKQINRAGKIIHS
jgi:hypothetical protein